MHIIGTIYSGYISLLLNQESENPKVRFRFCGKFIVIWKIEVACFNGHEGNYIPPCWIELGSLAPQKDTFLFELAEPDMFTFLYHLHMIYVVYSLLIIIVQITDMFTDKFKTNI